MVEQFPCLTCGKVWVGRVRCHCASCHESFSSAKAFDRHRRGFSCQPVAESLVLDEWGYWTISKADRTPC